VRTVWIALAALTVVAVAVGAWFYVRDEYVFQDVGDGDVAGLTYEGPTGDGWARGSVDDPPAELAGWIRGWERDTSGESVSTDITVTIVLSDGRAIRVDAGGTRGYATWIAADGTTGQSLAVHLNDAFVRYVEGVGDGLTAAPAIPDDASPSPPGVVPSPT
jgi:hypothetical protein